MSGILKGVHDDGTPWEHYYDVDLGGGHWLAYTSVSKFYEIVMVNDKRCCRAIGDETVRIGAIIYHRSAKKVPWAADGWCWCGMRFALSPYEEKHRAEIALPNLWQFDGNFDQPTFSPSILCGCKACHMFIRGGKWIDAGCTHAHA